MLYKRVGLAENRAVVLALAKEGIVDERPAAQIRDPWEAGVFHQPPRPDGLGQEVKPKA